MAPRTAALFAAGALAGISVPRAGAQPADSFRLRLEEQSKFLEHFCLDPCDCVEFDQSGPMTGAFNLVLLERGPLYETYAVCAVHLDAAPDGRATHLTGSGRYQIGGEFALQHRMVLDLTQDGWLLQPLDSGLVTPDGRAFPNIDIHAVEERAFKCTQVELFLFGTPTCPADFNGDSFVDGIDADLFNSVFEGGGAEADWNGDGFIDGIDYDTFMNHFETPC